MPLVFFVGIVVIIVILIAVLSDNDYKEKKSKEFENNLEKDENGNISNKEDFYKLNMLKNSEYTSHYLFQIRNIIVFSFILTLILAAIAFLVTVIEM